MEFQWFWCVHSMSNFKMSIKPKEFQWFWCVRSMSNFKMLIKPKEFQWFWCVSQWANEPMSQSANPPTSQIGIRWSGTKKCSQRYEIDHFCLGIFAGIQPSEFVSWSGTGIFGFTHPISDIPMTPSWSLRTFSELEVGMFWAAHRDIFSLRLTNACN